MSATGELERLLTTLGTALEGVHRVQEHRLPCHPAELLELLASRPRAGSRRHDHHTDVRRLRRLGAKLGRRGVAREVAG